MTVFSFNISIGSLNKGKLERGCLSYCDTCCPLLEFCCCQTLYIIICFVQKNAVSRLYNGHLFKYIEKLCEEDKK